LLHSLSCTSNTYKGKFTYNPSNSRTIYEIRIVRKQDNITFLKYNIYNILNIPSQVGEHNLQIPSLRRRELGRKALVNTPTS